MCAKTLGFKNKNNSSVIYVNLGAKDRRMGGSVISQIYDIHEKKCPKLDNVENFIFVIELLQSMHEKNKIVLIATHNREIAKKADYTLSISDGNIKRVNG